jgi:DNA invertase Pin-like site-specific DNA recombinase
MTKITAEHLARTAYVYIRQSTPDQLVHNKESQRRQYALADRARQLGWTGVEIVDDDLGRSGGGVARPGFDRLIGAICAGDVGAVLAIEASRLARNGRDWHMLIEFCGLVATIIVDEDGIYDPKSGSWLGLSAYDVSGTTEDCGQAELSRMGGSSCRPCR